MPVRRSQICVCVSKASKHVLFQGHTLDIALKKVKHRVVESMASDTADALGLSRAILCNDLLVKKLNRLENSGNLYKKMIRHLSALLNAYYRVARSQKGSPQMENLRRTPYFMHITRIFFKRLLERSSCHEMRRTA
ncbi:PRKCA-binding protein [Toxocara canis]|uniref:PRKCA-binding protein n=1 Tax=Toxocara canis TaxID=6265 RepID=A0A0B2VCJ0_TOXCA|nr:PRKCA-binding protein [Toxocara canis]